MKSTATSQGFLTYLKKKLEPSAFDFLYRISSFSDVVIFSGVIRNYFIKYNGEIRDLDIVINCDEEKFEKFLSSFEFKKNSFGGYKIKIGFLQIDVWHIEKTWAFRNSKISLDLFNVYNLPKTSFFNFSSAVFDFNNKKFICSNSFKNFVRTKKIDLVLEENPIPQLCIVNTIYYLQKYNLGISKNLQLYYLKHFYEYTEQDYERVQLKHFNEVKFSYSYLKIYLEIFERKLNFTVKHSS